MTDYEAVAREWLVGQGIAELYERESFGSMDDDVGSLAALLRREVEAAVKAEREDGAEWLYDYTGATPMSGDIEILEKAARDFRARGTP